MSFVLVARLKAKAGEEASAVAVLEELVAATRQEPGCELYIPCRDPEDAGSLLVYEQYADRAAYEAHGASEHFQRLAVGRLWDLLESRGRTFYETL